MTLDGEWVVLVENDGAPCDSSAYDERISMVRTDGTGHRVIVDWPVIRALQPGQVRIIERIRVSPTGRQVYFEQSVYSNCEQVGYRVPFVVDSATGAVSEPSYQGQPAYIASYADDGERVVFHSLDESAGASVYRISDYSLQNSRVLLDTSPWWAVFSGKLSGDGGTFLFVGWYGSAWGDVFVLDMGTGTITKLSPEAVPEPQSADISADGSRVIYGSWSSAGLVAVNGDGTDLRQISEVSQTGVATLSRDGEIIYGLGEPVRIGFNNWIQTTVYRWEDGALIDAFLGGTLGFHLQHMAITGDGSMIATVQGAPPVGLHPAMVRTESPAFLTTYGFGEPGTPLHWDVCAAAGSDWVLAASLRKGLLPLPGVGDLLLSPEHLFVLGAGTISDPYNASTVTREIPVDAALPEVLPLHSQALVVSSEGEARLTNRTTFELHGAQATTVELAASSSGPGGVADGPVRGVPGDAMARRPSLWELSPAERLRRMELMDPSITWRRERGLLPAGNP